MTTETAPQAAGLAVCLWFDEGASAAARFYVDAFRACGRPAVHEGGVPEPSAMAATARLDGLRLIALNGRPAGGFTAAASLVVTGADQAEVDRFWAALSANGGTPGRCGWLTDRFGVSWQVVPAALPTLLGDPDPARRARVMRCFMGMGRIDEAALRAAAAAAD